MKESNILIVDDNKSILSAFELMLFGRCKKVKTLSSPNLLLNELKRNSYDVLLLDMNFSAGINSGNEGIYWLQRALEQEPGLSIVMITAYGDVELAVKAVHMGATDFVLKPWDNEKMLTTIESAWRLSQSRKEIKTLKLKEKQLIAEINRPGQILIGFSPPWKRVMDLVRKVASTDVNVLITGENGVGKELVAHEIHCLSARADKVMVTVDMGSITESLFESELFGHVKGAFTDAHENRPGKFETADKGTLFLDEIGNLSVHLQSKLLAAIENLRISRIGSNQLIPIDIRLICATNKNLGGMVNEGLFREDLLYRINTIHLEVPPLRERENDIILLADFFLKKFANKYNKPNLKIHQHAQEQLLRYPWPGNIRELQHTIEKAVILCETAVLKPDDFYLRHTKTLKNSNSIPTIEEMEKQLIQQALEKNNGNFSSAADQLGITRQTLYNKLKKSG